MARAFYQPRPGNTVEDYTRNNRYYHQPSNTWFQMLRRGGKFYQRRWQPGPGGRELNAEELQIDYVLGSGNHVRTYLHRTARNTLVELPLAWYPEHNGAWAMNPGFEGPHLETRRKVSYECMFCHNAYPGTPVHSESPVYNAQLPEGIDCQRCHGPGADHAKTPNRANILNPARLSPDRQMEVCMQCHLQSTAAALPSELRVFGRAPFSYNPAEPLDTFKVFFDKQPAPPGRDIEIVSSAYRLRQSQCFLKSAGKLVCETCHNPHDIPRAQAAIDHYDSVCRQCHAAAHTQAPAHNCAGCHMPKRQTKDVIHATITDHLIQRRPLPTAPQTPSPYRGEVVAYYPTNPGALLIAAAQVINNANLAAGIPSLQAELTRSPNPEAYIVLGDAHRHNGNPAEAAVAYRKSCEQAPTSRALRNWAVSLKASGNPGEAGELLRRATQQFPNDPENWYEVGLLDSEQSRPTEAIVELRKAIELDPDLAVAYNTLAIDLSMTGQLDQAEAAFRTALAIDPYDPATSTNLARLLAARSGAR
jgi:Flp pilus assembly protein TadD